VRASLHRVRLLGIAIAAVVIVAIVVVTVEEPRVSSQASPPAPANAVGPALPATVQTPTAAPARPIRTTPTATGGVPRATHLSTAWGIDVSWPQCDAPWAGVGQPTLQPGFVVVGVNDGKPFTDNPCLAAETNYARTRTGVAAYLNIDAPRSGSYASYGKEVALDGLARLQRAHLSVPVVWLDVEVMNHWSTSGAGNVAVIAAAVRAIQSRGLVAGIYSSGPMWQQITGGATLTVPVWLATNVTDYHQLPQWCLSGLGGQPADMTQYIAYDGQRLVDVDVLCPKKIPAVVGDFGPGAK
jgi:GH25 family lysozyme M1 (1,4-beta-N-acetylmuramidase)